MKKGLGLRPIDGDTIICFIEQQKTKRIRQVSFNFYQSCACTDFFGLGLYLNDRLIGITASSWKSEYGITVIAERYRNKGFGKLLLKEKLDKFRKCKLKYVTSVAKDNALSYHMCLSLGLKPIKEEIKTRQGGREEYTLVTFSD